MTKILKYIEAPSRGLGGKLMFTISDSKENTVLMVAMQQSDYQRLQTKNDFIITITDLVKQKMKNTEVQIDMGGLMLSDWYNRRYPGY